jgi:putative membrane protein
MLHAISATALFRCWHIIAFFSAWATAISVINHTVHRLTIETTLLTVYVIRHLRHLKIYRMSRIGTVLGFVISYRTTSSFERYNEGRRLWSQIILASRTFARTLWFHVPGKLS